MSRELRAAVAATGRDLYPLGSLGARKVIHFGDLRALQLMHQHGELHDRDLREDEEDRQKLVQLGGGEGTTRNTEVDAREWLLV